MVRRKCATTFRSRAPRLGCTAILVWALLAAAPAGADPAATGPASEPGELAELRHEAAVLGAVRDLDEVLATVRDNAHPSDLIEKYGVKETGWGSLIKQAGTLCEQLSQEFASAPKWLTGSLDKINAAKKLAAGVDAPTRLARDIHTARTASAEQQLKDLSAAIKDMKELVGALVAVNPVVSIYLTVATKAIDSIAENAKVIAAATARTNRAIEEAGKSLGAKQEVAAGGHPLDAAIEAIDERIHAIESEQARKAFDEVKGAETSCAKQDASTREAMIRLRLEVDALERSVARGETALKALKAERAALDLLIAASAKEIARLEILANSGRTGALGARNKLDAERQSKKILDDERADLVKHEPATRRSLEAGLKRDRDRLGKRRPPLERFQACVACGLASAKFATRGYLIERFPRYLQDRAAQADLLGPLLYAGRKNGPFAGTKFSWFHVEDFNDHKLDAKGVSGNGKPSSSFGAKLVDSVDGDAWWGSGTLTFEFSAKVLGNYPTHVGLVWTDGAPGTSVTVQAWDACGNSRTFPAVSGFADGDYEGGTAEDRFFGVVSANGVAKLRIANSDGGIEVDDLQYGRK